MVWALRSPTFDPTRRVAGLPIALRQVLTLQKAGTGPVVLAEDGQGAVIGVRTGSQRVPRWWTILVRVVDHPHRRAVVVDER